MTHEILVVEDDPLFGEMFRDSLAKAFDATVVWFANNSSAIEYLEQRMPSLVLTDLRRPDGGGGEDLVEYIRSSPRLRGVPVILLSGNLFHGRYDTRVFAHRIDAAFAKPVRMEELFEAAGRCLGDANADASLVRVGTESRWLDYKRTIDLDDKKQRACVAKDVLAFANSGGGSIVVGMDESAPGVFMPVGVSDLQAQRLEVSRLNDALRRYTGTELSVQSRRFWWQSKLFIVISIPPCVGTIALAREEHADAGLFPGRIYVRNDAAQSAEVRDATTLAKLIERVVKERK